MTNSSENININILEQQMSDNEDICCSCGIIRSFPEALRHDFRVADVGIIGLSGKILGSFFSFIVFCIFAL